MHDRYYKTESIYLSVNEISLGIFCVFSHKIDCCWRFDVCL